MVFITPIGPNATEKNPPTESERAKISAKSAAGAVSAVSPIKSEDAKAQEISAAISSATNALESELFAILDESNLKSVKLTLPILKETTSILKELSNLDKKSEVSKLEVALKESLEKLNLSALLIKEESFSNPETLTKTLSGLTNPQSREQIDNALRGFKEIFTKLPPKEDLKLIHQIFQKLERFVAEHLESENTDLKIPVQKLVIDIRLLLAEQSAKITEDTSEKVKVIISQLDSLLLKENPPGEVKRTVQQFLSLLNEVGIKDSKTISQLLDADRLLERIETLAKAQTHLNQINTIMNTLGEPSLFVFAALIGSDLTRFKFTHSKIEDEEKRKKAGAEGFHQINIEVNLPSFGLVVAAIAYRKKEFLLKLTVEDETFATFISERLPKLRENLLRLNYDLLSFEVTHGNQKEIDPGWVHGLLDRGERIA